MRIGDLFEAIQNTVVIYPGRFHPFHKGHAAVYKWLSSKFDNVYIATSNKIDPPKSPFSFAEKKQMMMHAGVPASAIVQVKNPYIAAEITDKYDPDNTVAVFAVSEKDMAEDPRFQFKPKKDGSPSYYRPYGSNMEPLNKHGYIITTPTFDFTVLGEPMRSATELRRDFAAADVETQAKMIKDLYGSYNKTIHKIMAAKITQ
jgi:cytidyltransferase-like protein